MVPAELKAYHQWVLWREVVLDDGKRTKIPYTIRGDKASTTDPSTWSTFEQACTACQRLLMNGIGFVLTRNDPFGCIDCDPPFKEVPYDEGQKIADRHLKIMQAFQSYTEVSPSGEGFHIWIKGELEHGRRRNKVEVYTSERFMTVTGNTYYDLPISDRGWLLHELWKELDDGRGNNGNGQVKEQTQKYTDDQIYIQAKEAENGEKFLNLWNGHWMDAGYKSQSEADFALINILSFYSRNVDQIRRLFFASALGARDKAKRKDYISNMVQRSFDNQPLYVELEDLTSSIKEQLDASKKIKQSDMAANPFAGPLFQGIPDPDYDWTIPPGLLGEIAQYIYAQAPRQVKEIALAAAIGLMAGICGRQYNISGTGLNQYLLMLAGTGTGKEAMRSGIDKLMSFVKLSVPAAIEYIGPSDIASGQAIAKYIVKNPCFISIVGEFGLFMQNMCAYNASQSQVTLRKKFLEFYNKSGEKDVMQPTIYSEKEKNTAIVHSPSFSLLGESVPESWYGGLDEGMIAQGLLPRFMCIEYLGPRPPLNKGFDKVIPTDDLVRKVAELSENVLRMAHNSRVIHIQLDAEAQKFADDFEKQTTDNINNSDINIAKELWNRAHLKMLKLAGLIAIGLDMYRPTVSLECIQWAHALIERDIRNVFDKFERGRIGKNTNEGGQIADMTLLIRDYLVSPYDDKLQKYLVDSRMHQDRVIAHSYFLRRLQQKTSFRNDKMGATFAIKRTVENLVSDGALQEVRQLAIKDRYGKSLKAYGIVDMSRFI